MTEASALYVGSVSHHRMGPKPHGFHYSAFWALIDLNELPTLVSRLRLFSHNRFNFFAFYDRDHGDGGITPLRLQVERQLTAAKLEPDGGSIRLFAMPRILGFSFNPLSIYFCYRADSHLQALIYEVHNTFGRRHSYVIPVEHEAKTICQDCDKELYVSPFMDMEMHYAFQVDPPAEEIRVVIDTSQNEQLVLNACLFGVRRRLTDAACIRLFCAIPFVSMKVVAAIHWEALRLWLKGVRLRPRPAPPADLFKIVTDTPKRLG